MYTNVSNFQTSQPKKHKSTCLPTNIAKACADWQQVEHENFNGSTAKLPA